MSSDDDSGPFGTISRSMERLHDASVLLDFARGQPDAAKSSLFCGCACMLLVVALEEEVSAVVRMGAEEHRRMATGGKNHNGVPGLAGLRDAKLPRRVLDVPKLISRGRLCLRRSGGLVDALWELLKLRNVLAHDTPTDLWDLDSEAGALERKVLSSLKGDPWGGIRVGSVERYVEAVRSYIDELVELDLDDEGTYQGGAVIGPVSA